MSVTNIFSRYKLRFLLNVLFETYLQLAQQDKTKYNCESAQRLCHLKKFVFRSLYYFANSFGYHTRNNV